MSWSDHKDDKKRFDGWREFLNKKKNISLGPETAHPKLSDKDELDKIEAAKADLEWKEYYGELTEPEATKLARLRKNWKNALGMLQRSRKAGKEFFTTGPEPLGNDERHILDKITKESKKAKLTKQQLQQIIREELTKVLREGPGLKDVFGTESGWERGAADPHTQAFDDFIEALKAGAEIHGDALAPTEQAIKNATEPLLNGVTLSDAHRARLLGTLEPLRNMIKSGNFDNAHLISLAAEAAAEMADIENKARIDNFVNKVTSEHTEMIRARQLLQDIDDIDYIDAVIKRLGGEVAPLQDETIDGEFERKIAWIMDEMASKISTPRHER